MHRVVCSRPANVPPVSKPKPAWRRRVEEGFSESSAIDNSRILNGWTKEAAGRFNGRSSKGLVLFCIDVSGSMRNIKNLLAQYVISIIKILYAISSGLSFGVVFYTDYDEGRSSPVVWSPMSLEWHPEKLASFLRNSIVEGGGGTNCESFDVAFNYILREIVPFYRQTGADNSPVLVINLTDEDMRVFTREYSNYPTIYDHVNIKGTFSYGYLDTDPFSSTYLSFRDNVEKARVEKMTCYSQIEQGSSSNGRVHADSMAECVGALNEYIARWGGGVVTNGDLREMCFENNVYLRIIKFDKDGFQFRGESNHAGYADLCKDSFDRIQLFKCEARSQSPEEVNLPGFLIKMIERFFKSLTHDLSSSFMLGMQQDVINKNQVNPNNVISKVECFDRTQAQVEDLKNRVMDKNSKERTGIFILDNSTGEIDYEDNQIFLSSHCDGHVFTHTLLATPGSEVGTYVIDNDAQFAERFKKYDPHMAAILSKMIPGEGTNRDVVDYIYGEIGEDASDEKCCTNCFNRASKNKQEKCYPTMMDTKIAIAKYFAIMLLKAMIEDSSMVTCCKSILDVVGAVYAFICSSGSSNCGMVNRILGAFCTAVKNKGDFLHLLRENKHVNDVNHDTVSRVNCRIHSYIMEGTNFGPDFWMYLRNRDAVINHANAIIKSHSLDKYKTFEHQDCYDLVETVVKNHLVVAKRLPEYIKEEVKDDGVIGCERLIAIPVMASSLRSPAAVGDDDIFSSKLAIAYIMSLVGRKFSIQRPLEISGLKSVIAAAAAAASYSSTQNRMSSVVKRLCKEYFVEWIDKRSRQEGWPNATSSLDFNKLLFKEDGCVRNNLTNWPCLKAIQKAAPLYSSDDKIIDTIRLYKLLVKISNPKIFNGVTKHAVHAFELGEVDSEQCSRCTNVCSKNTEIVEGSDGKRYCVWCLKYKLSDCLKDKIFKRIAEKMKAGGVFDGYIDSGARNSTLTDFTKDRLFDKMEFMLNSKSYKRRKIDIKIEREKEEEVDKYMIPYRFSPQLIGKWKICKSVDGMEEAFNTDYTLKETVKKLMSGNKKNSKEAAFEILQNYMNIGKGPVSLDVAKKVCSAILNKSLVSKYIEGLELGSTDYTRTLDTSLVLQCFGCRRKYKGSMLAPVRSRHRRCPLCRAKKRLPAEFVDAVVRVSRDVSLSDAEMLWFLSNVDEFNLNFALDSFLIECTRTDDSDDDSCRSGDEETALNVLDERAASNVLDERAASNVLNEGTAGDRATDNEDKEDKDLIDMIMDVDGDDEEKAYKNGMTIKKNSGQLSVEKVKLPGFSGFGSMKVSYKIEGGEIVNPFKDVNWKSFVDTMVIRPLYGRSSKGKSMYAKMVRWKSSFSDFVSTPNQEFWKFAKKMSRYRTTFKKKEVSKSIVDACVRKLAAKM